MANGLAAICCKEKPNPTINNPDINKGNDSLLDAGTKRSVPNAEIIRPNDKPFR